MASRWWPVGRKGSRQHLGSSPARVTRGGPSQGLPLEPASLAARWGHGLLLRLCGTEHNCGAFSGCLINAQCPALRLDVDGGKPWSPVLPLSEEGAWHPEGPCHWWWEGFGLLSSPESDIWKEAGLGLT